MTTATETVPAETTATTATTAPATTTDNAQTTTETPPVLSDREKVMEQITAQNEQRIVDEHKEKGITIEGLAPKEETTTTEDQLATQLDADKPTVLSDGLEKVMVTVKIDGEEKQVSVAEMQRQFQFGNAAQMRLEEAARDRREAARLLAEAETRSKASPPVGVDPSKAAPDSTTQAAPQDEDPKAAAKRIVKALFEGDEDGAIEAVEKIVAGRQAPTQPDAQQIASQVKQQLSVDSALEQFSKDYKDIVSDPYLATLADQFLAAEVQDSTKSYAQALDAAGKKTRDWLAAKTGSPAVDPASTMDRTQKLERKAGIDNVQALNTKATIVEEPVQSPSDVIAEMRKQRGLA